MKDATRVVAYGLFGLAALGLCLTAWLLSIRVEAGPVAAVATSSTGALAAFLAGVQVGGRNDPPGPSAVI